MALLIAGLVVFLGIHSLALLAPALRLRLVARLGAGPWRGLYALVALAGLAMVVAGFGSARAAPLVLYAPPAGLRTLAVVLLAPVAPLWLAAYLPGRLRERVPQPLLLGTALWAGAHLLANGRLADVLLFGGFLVWALADRASLRRRPPTRYAALPAGRFNDALAVLLGLALYGALLLGGHQRLFGVAPLG